MPPPLVEFYTAQPIRLNLVLTTPSIKPLAAYLLELGQLLLIMSDVRDVIDLTVEGALHTASPVMAASLSGPVSKSAQRRQGFPTNARRPRDFRHFSYPPEPLTTMGRKLMVEENPVPKGMIILGVSFLDDYQLSSRTRPSYDQQWYYVNCHAQLKHLMTVFADFIRKDPANLYFYYRKTQINPERTYAEVS
jgi:hypothetical protein